MPDESRTLVQSSFYRLFLRIVWQIISSHRIVPCPINHKHPVFRTKHTYHFKTTTGFDIPKPHKKSNINSEPVCSREANPAFRDPLKWYSVHFRTPHPNALMQLSQISRFHPFCITHSLSQCYKAPLFSLQGHGRNRAVIFFPTQFRYSLVANCFVDSLRPTNINAIPLGLT